jgi:molecular chaperone GrpE
MKRNAASDAGSGDERERAANPADAPEPAETDPPAGLPDGPGPDFGTPEPVRAEEADYKDRWLRAEAEIQNYRRRVQREQEQVRRDAEEAVLRDMVGVLDDLERALTSLTPEDTKAPWVQGITLVAQRMRDTLARHGVEAIDPLGQAFDPVTQEAILEVDAPEGAVPGTVVQVVHKGYRRRDRTLRPARVIVAREPVER